MEGREVRSGTYLHVPTASQYVPASSLTHAVSRSEAIFPNTLKGIDTSGKETEDPASSIYLSACCTDWFGGHVYDDSAVRGRFTASTQPPCGDHTVGAAVRILGSWLQRCDRSIISQIAIIYSYRDKGAFDGGTMPDNEDGKIGRIVAESLRSEAERIAGLIKAADSRTVFDDASAPLAFAGPSTWINMYDTANSLVWTAVVSPTGDHREQFLNEVKPSPDPVVKVIEHPVVGATSYTYYYQSGWHEDIWMTAFKIGA